MAPGNLKHTEFQFTVNTVETVIGKHRDYIVAALEQRPITDEALSDIFDRVRTIQHLTMLQTIAPEMSA